MANLNGQYLDSLTLYKGLINIGSTVGQNVTSSLQSLTDGDGNNLPIQVSTTQIIIGGGSSLGRLVVRGDGINPIGIFEHTDGTAALTISHSPLSIGIQTSGSWIAYNNSSKQLVGIQGGLFAIINTSVRFQINLSTNEVALSGRLLGSASTAARASINIPSGVAPTSPANGDIWFDGTDFKTRVGGVTKTFTLV